MRQRPTLLQDGRVASQAGSAEHAGAVGVHNVQQPPAQAGASVPDSDGLFPAGLIDRQPVAQPPRQRPILPPQGAPVQPAAPVHVAAPVQPDPVFPDPVFQEPGAHPSQTDLSQADPSWAHTSQTHLNQTHVPQSHGMSTERTQAPPSKVRALWSPVAAKSSFDASEAVPAAVAPPKRQSSWRVALVSFVFGAICWHLVGFWSFMSDVITPDRSRTAERVLAKAADRPKTVAKSQGLPELDVQVVTGADPTTVAKAEARACIELVIDRTTNLAKSVSCKPIIRGTVFTETKRDDSRFASRSARLTIPLRTPGTDSWTLLKR